MAGTVLPTARGRLEDLATVYLRVGPLDADLRPRIIWELDKCRLM